MAKLLTQTFFQFDQEAPMSRTSPSSVTCYSCDLSHLKFPILLPPTSLGSTRVGPLTSSTVASSITLLPEDNDGQVKILSVTSLPSPDTPMLKVQYKNEGEAPARALLATSLKGSPGSQAMSSSSSPSPGSSGWQAGPPLSLQFPSWTT